MKGKKVLVFGTGVSGIAAACLLAEKEAQVFLFDNNDELDVADIKKKLKTAGLKKPVDILLGVLPGQILQELDLAVLSPGVPTDLPLVNAIRSAGIDVWGEIELAAYYAKGDILAVTGTNGKTTTTALLGEIMKAARREVYVVGNIGIPFTQVAARMTENAVTVAEISSFQLETIHQFTPQISAVLNITPDHLNRHHTMENYTAVKLSIAKNQTRRQYCILNYEDEALRRASAEIPATVIFFSSKHELEQGVYLKDDEIWLNTGSKAVRFCHVGELKLIGKHNYENVMAASAMAYYYGVPVGVIRKVLSSFQAVEHRIEYVTTKRGVRFYNDSKGTNPDAAIQAIRAMQWPTCLIGGGYDKQSEYEEWIESFEGKVKLLVLIGQTKEKIAQAAKRCGFHDYVFADTLEEAVGKCCNAAVAGDAVLLSPACASWGMFPNYEKRGEIFKEIVHNLKE